MITSLTEQLSEAVERGLFRLLPMREKKFVVHDLAVSAKDSVVTEALVEQDGQPVIEPLDTEGVARAGLKPGDTVIRKGRVWIRG